MLRRKALVLGTILILLAQLLATAVIRSAYALASPASVNVDLQFNFDAAKGFEKIVRNTNAPEFVLKRGAMGVLNISLTSYENGLVLVTLWFGGDAPYVNWGLGTSLPDGITYNIEPNTTNLAARSSETATLRVATTSDVPIKRYNISVVLDLYRGAAPPHSVEREIHPITLTTVAGISPPTTTNTSGVTTTYVNRTITSTATHSTTLTSISTTTHSTIITSMTTITATIQAIDPSTYAWALSATAATMVLAVILLRHKRH